jgi:peptidyl-prolyl cis-trans isomerase D
LTIKDSDVKVYWCWDCWLHEEKRKEFKTDDSREVEYVLIEDKASKEDEAEVSRINQLLTGSVVYNQATGKMIL